MSNPERGAVRIKSEDGKRIYVLRLRLAALSLLQRELSTPERLVSPDQVLGQIQDMLEGRNEDLGFFMHVMLAALQEFHSGQFKTVYDVDDFLEDVGGLEGVRTQLAPLAESVRPDPEDVKRRVSDVNPRKGRSKRA